MRLQCDYMRFYFLLLFSFILVFSAQSSRAQSTDEDGTATTTYDPNSKTSTTEFHIEHKKPTLAEEDKAFEEGYKDESEREQRRENAQEEQRLQQQAYDLQLRNEREMERLREASKTTNVVQESHVNAQENKNQAAADGRRTAWDQYQGWAIESSISLIQQAADDATNNSYSAATKSAALDAIKRIGAQLQQIRKGPPSFSDVEAFDGFLTNVPKPSLDYTVVKAEVNKLAVVQKRSPHRARRK